MNTVQAGTSDSPTGESRPGLVGDQSTWSIFVRLELMGPINNLVLLAELLDQEAAGIRPEQYLEDVRKVRQAADRLLRLATELLAVAQETTPADLDAELRRARHDLGNRLNQLVGMVQLLQIEEEDLLGALLPRLEQILELCRECEGRLLRQGSAAASRKAGHTEAEVALVVEHLKTTGTCEPPAERLSGRVLIADDDPVNREVLRRLLEYEGLSVAEAADGREALLVLGERSFDVLLLDIMMPGLNGFQVLQRLRENGHLRRTSVIVNSALDEVQNLVRCLEAGADDYLTKPVDKALLRARVNSCLMKRRQRAHDLAQFFPPEVVNELLDRPELLQTGRTAEVSILFCDIRGFSRISERLRETPERMVEWLSAVMDALAECVLRHQGVLVDFIGDELLAMWGAPQEQPDHADRACRAALDMVARVSTLSEVWREVIGEETAVGVGIDSGPASVGNTGTKKRFKYGPLGNTVNLASRIQGATKYLQARILLTQATRDRLGSEFSLRRLARLQVVNIQEPVAVHELVPGDEEGWEELRDGYERALALYESGTEHLQDAARILGGLVTRHGLGGPNLFLLSRILGAMQDRSSWSGVCALPGK